MLQATLYADPVPSETDESGADLYDGAALRHCCRLLYEIEVAAAAGLELSVRMLGRAHMEAWLVALYLHFGGYQALLKVAQDARHSLEGIELEARQFDEWLAAEKTAARKSGRKVAATNGGIAQWTRRTLTCLRSRCSTSRTCRSSLRPAST
jgi:hypothetical protein